METLHAAITNVPPGIYVAAVSGGVDSVALLDLLVQNKSLSLVVAHVNHGIRSDAADDAVLVRKYAHTHGLPVYEMTIKLGDHASEADARTARYDFLRSVTTRVGASGILAAHHRDDLVETIALHIIRGTYRKGLSPLSAPDIFRPLLGIPKETLVAYAQARGLQWHEDSTNSDITYLRNHLRKNLRTDVTPQKTEAVAVLMQVYQQMLTHNNEIIGLYDELDHWIMPNQPLILRSRFAVLPHKIARDYIARHLQLQRIQYDAQLLERIVVALKVQKPNSRVSTGRSSFVKIDRKTAQLLVQ